VLTCCKGDGQSQWKTPIFVILYVCDDQSTVRTQLFAPACCRVLGVYTLFEGVTEFFFVF